VSEITPEQINALITRPGMHLYLTQALARMCSWKHGCVISVLLKHFEM